VLTYVSWQAQSTSIGQVSINRDIIHVLSSTPGIILDVKTDADGRRMLGIAFEPDNDNLLWFIQKPDEGGAYFYLACADEAAREIEYGGYSVSYEKATGHP
jgi:hypothetical protein